MSYKKINVRYENEYVLFFLFAKNCIKFDAIYLDKYKIKKVYNKKDIKFNNLQKKVINIFVTGYIFNLVCENSLSVIEKITSKRKIITFVDFGVSFYFILYSKNDNYIIIKPTNTLNTIYIQYNDIFLTINIGRHTVNIYHRYIWKTWLQKLYIISF